MQAQETLHNSIVAPTEPLLDINAVSVLLNIKPCTLYAWAAKGRIPCLKIHGLVRFRRAENCPNGCKAFRNDPRLRNPCECVRALLTSTELIARAKRHVYNPRPRGNQTESSPIGKETRDGAM